MSTELLAKLAALRDAKNTSIFSSTKTPFTLATYLILYHKSNTIHYIAYQKGHLALLNYLTCNGTMPLDLELDKYPRILDATLKVPSILGSWNLNDLCEKLSGKAYGAENSMYNRAIYLTAHDLAMRGLI